jgi:CIC family chloride channel protein
MDQPEAGIDKVRKTVRRRIHDLVFAEDTVLVSLAIIIGFLAGLGAWGFLELINFFRLSWQPWGAYSGFVVGDITTLLIPLVPALGGLLLGPFGAIFPTEAKGHGVPEVMESVVRQGGILKPRTIFIRGIASAITIGTGGSAGREGPIAQIGSAIGSYVAQVFKLSSNNVRTLLGCGAAGGIAAAFNAPIAGALFALEIVLGDWHITTFTPVIMSSVIATVTSRYLHGGKATFDVPYYQLVNPVEIIFYIILGLLSGLVALLFIHSLDKSEHFFEEKVRVHPWLKPALGGFLVGVIGLAFPQIFSNGYEPMGLALMGNMAFWLMLSLVFMKILATSITLGSGGSGGIFAPALYIGAMLGGAFGTIINFLFPFMTAQPGAYALVGMGSLLAAAAHAPLTNYSPSFRADGRLPHHPPHHGGLHHEHHHHTRPLAPQHLLHRSAQERDHNRGGQGGQRAPEPQGQGRDDEGSGGHTRGHALQGDPPPYHLEQVLQFPHGQPLRSPDRDDLLSGYTSARF